MSSSLFCEFRVFRGSLSNSKNAVFSGFDFVFNLWNGAFRTTRRPARKGPNMRSFAISLAALLLALPAPAQPPKDTRLAEFTRERYLKVKVSVEMKDTLLRDVLKEFAAQVQMDKEFEHPVMWTYADADLGDKTVTYACTDKPIEDALKELANKVKFGWFVISKDDHIRDGWVRITSGSERGFGALGTAPAPKTDDDETTATSRLDAAKEQIDKGRKATAKAVLTGIIDKYPKTKAAAEAKTLLEKLDK